MRSHVVAPVAALLLAGCVVAPDGSLAPAPAPGATIPPPAPPVAYAPPADADPPAAEPGVPVRFVPAAPPPAVVPVVGIGVGLGWGWGRGYWGRPHRRW